MKKSEIVQLLAVVNTAFPNMQVSEAMVDLWFELLGDLDFNLAKIALKKLLLESPYPPAIADIRKQATEILTPAEGRIEPAAAWGEVIRAVHNYGYYRPIEAMASLSPIAAQVVKYMGWQEICMSEEPSVIRGQFLKMYQQVQEREKKDAILPEKLKSEIAAIAAKHDLKLVEGGKQ